MKKHTLLLFLLYTLFIQLSALQIPPLPELSQIEFELSTTEKREIENLIKRLDETEDSFPLALTNAANNGDRVAMYFAGQSSLLGIGTTINKQVATLYFKSASSLGYAPALFEIFQMYLHEKQDPLLALVYLNLTISHGHREYYDLYQKHVDWLEKFGQPLVIKEIERIAFIKSIEMEQTKSELKNKKGTYLPGLALQTRNITHLDSMYSDEYWKEFFSSAEAWSAFFSNHEK